MKQCPRCNRTYSDDDLSYCLEDGSILVRPYDPEATINPFQPSSNLPPTVAYTAPSPPPPTPSAPVSAPAPEPRSRSALAVGAMVLAALAIGLAIGGIIMQRYSSPSRRASSSTSPTPRPMTATTTTTTPTPASVTPTATPLPNIAQSTPKPEPDCVLYNDKADKSMVRVRTNCDTQDCEKDASTIAGEYPDNTRISIVKGSTVRGARFTWVKVIITNSGRAVWVASSKIRCP